ncbi:hypothetical protein BpHYR1_036400, partial [Brachionus plicatilis]
DSIIFQSISSLGLKAIARLECNNYVRNLLNQTNKSGMRAKFLLTCTIEFVYPAVFRYIFDDDDNCGPKTNS